MPRRPKGTVIRFDPDWDPYRMMYGPDNVTLASGNTTQCLGLYNNSPDGTALVVWDLVLTMSVNASLTPGTSFAAWGVTVQTPVNNPTPTFALIPSAGVGPGITYEIPHYNGNANFPFNAMVDTHFWEWSHPWPVCYIEPGYSLLIEFTSAVTSGNQFCTATYMYQYGVRLH